MARDYYRDPVSGNLIAKSVKVGDTLPIGFEGEIADGTPIPEGWVEVEYDTGWKTLSVTVTGSAYYRKIGKTVNIVASVKPTQNYSSVISGLPNDILPKQNITRYAVTDDRSGNGSFVLNKTDKLIWFYVGTNDKTYNIDFMYFIE